MASIEMAGMSLDADDDDDSSDSGSEVTHKKKKKAYTEEQIKMGNENKEKFHTLVGGLADGIVSRLEGEIRRLNGESGTSITVPHRKIKDENIRVIFWCEHPLFTLELDFLHWNLLDISANIRLKITLFSKNQSDEKFVPFVEEKFKFKYNPNITLENISKGGTTLNHYIKETSKRIVLYDALRSIEKIRAWKFAWLETHASVCLGFPNTISLRWFHIELCISESEDVVLEILYKEWYTINPSEVKAYNMDVKICSKEEFIRFINNELGIPPLKSQLLDLERRIDALRLTT